MKTYEALERDVLREVRDIAGEHVCRQAIRGLMQTPTKVPEDNERNLTSVWESIYYQVQVEESLFFELYLYEADKQIDYFTRLLPVHQRTAIWLWSKDGLDWEDDYDVSMDSDPINETIVREIRNNYVMVAAEGWSNKNIRRAKRIG